jgi:hypothetical protein
MSRDTGLELADDGRMNNVLKVWLMVVVTSALVFGGFITWHQTHRPCHYVSTYIHVCQR